MSAGQERHLHTIGEQLYGQGGTAPPLPQPPEAVQGTAGEPQYCPHGHLRIVPGDPVAERLGIGAAALRYAALGLPVFPLRPGTKRPATEHGFLDATTDPAVITSPEWWGGNRVLNIGIPTGAAYGLLVIDNDRKNGVDGVASLTAFLAERGLVLPQVPQVTTPGGGVHLWLRLNGRPVGSRAGVLPGVDIRGDGGYVCVWPSGIQLPRGMRRPGDPPPESLDPVSIGYTWHGCPCMAPVAPPELLDALEELRGSGGGGGAGGAGGGWNNLPELPPTEVLLEHGVPHPHDDNITRLAARLAGGGSSWEQAYPVLRRVADITAIAEPWTDDNLKRKFDSARGKGFGAPPPPGAVAWAQGTAGGQGAPLAGGGGPQGSSAQLAGEARERLHRHVRGWLGERECSRVDFAGAVCSTMGGAGEPLWGMMLAAASGGKTEVVRMAGGVSDASLDEFTSAALLSFSKAAKNPQPVGVLTRIPEKALITIADFSTILASSDRGLRDQLFADLRRVYDGQLNRDLGNMARGLHWEGRVTMLAASTPAIDEYSSHSDKLGPRWLYHRGTRTPTGDRRRGAGKRLTERELEANRAEARKLFTEMVTHAAACYPLIVLSEQAEAELGDIAVAAAICRSPVPRDGYGRRDITGLPVIEEPYRLAVQARSLTRGAMATGYSEAEGVALARRCAMDTVPPVRVRVLWVLRDGVALTAAEIGRRAETDRKVARRALEDLRALQVTACPVEDASDADEVGWASEQKLWMYSQSQDPEVAERVNLVREVVRKLSTSAGSVPNRGDNAPNPQL